MKHEMKPEWRFGREVWLWMGALQLVATAMLVAVVLGIDEPPNGWTGLIAAWVFVSVIYPLVIVLSMRIRSPQSDGIVIENGRLIVRTGGWKASVPFDKIAHTSLVHDPDWQMTDSYASWRARKLEPEWREAPNVEIAFKEPVRLGNFPVPWYTLLSLHVEDPDVFIAALQDDMTKRPD